MAATPTAILQQQPGSSWATAFPQVNTSQNLDILNIVDEGGNVVLNVDYAGVVHNPASGSTGSQTRLGQFQTRLAASDTTANYFADAFTNPSRQDIVQVIALGGNIAKYIDYAGVSH